MYRRLLHGVLFILLVVPCYARQVQPSPPRSPLPPGTEVKVQLLKDLSSANANVGDKVPFTVLNDVAIDGHVVIRQGSVCWGRITKVSKQLVTRAGKLEVSVESVQAADGGNVALRGLQEFTGKRSVVRGEEAVVKAGAEFSAIVVVAGEANTPAPTSETGTGVHEGRPSDSPVPASNPPVTKQLKDGDTAVVATALSVADATTKVKAYFDSKKIAFTVNPDSGRITSDWYGEHRCGVGFPRCANRATVGVVSEAGKTVQVQVFEGKRETGGNDKPWTEDSTSRGKETADLATQLETFLAR